MTVFTQTGPWWLVLAAVVVGSSLGGWLRRELVTGGYRLDDEWDRPVLRRPWLLVALVPLVWGLLAWRVGGPGTLTLLPALLLVGFAGAASAKKISNKKKAEIRRSLKKQIKDSVKLGSFLDQVQHNVLEQLALFTPTEDGDEEADAERRIALAYVLVLVIVDDAGQHVFLTAAPGLVLPALVTLAALDAQPAHV